jgi:hypothetical protein
VKEVLDAHGALSCSHHSNHRSVLTQTRGCCSASWLQHHACCMVLILSHRHHSACQLAALE